MSIHYSTGSRETSSFLNFSILALYSGVLRRQHSWLTTTIKKDLSGLWLPLDSNMPNILAFWPCCPPPTRIVLLPSSPYLLFFLILFPQCHPHVPPPFSLNFHSFIRLCSIPRNALIVPWGGKGWYQKQWRRWLVHSEAQASAIPQLWGAMHVSHLLRASVFSTGRQEGAGPGNNSQVPSSFPRPGSEQHRGGISYQGHPRDLRRPGRGQALESLLNLARWSGKQREWAGTAARKAGETHGERRSPPAREAPSDRNPLAGPNLRTPPCWNHVTVARPSAQPQGSPPLACWEL